MSLGRVMDKRDFLAIDEAIEQGLVDIVEVLEALGVDTGKGVDSSGELNLTCLTNSETAPSLFINTRTGIYNCFSCKSGGNFLKLVGSLLRDGTESCTDIDWGEACQYVLGNRDISELKYKALKRMILAPDEDKEEVTLRKFDHLFRDRYSTPNYSSLMLKYWVEDHGVAEETLRRFRVRDVFRGYYKFRSIIPIRRGRKRVAFEARMYLSKKKWERLNPWRFANEGYRKVLYPRGWSSKENVWVSGSPRGKTVVIVEGVPNAMRYVQLGFVGMAILGSKPHVNQMAEISEAERVMLAFDRDSSGRSARKATLEIIRESYGGGIFKIGMRKEGTDPCDYNDDALMDGVDKAKDVSVHSRVAKLLQLRGRQVSVARKPERRKRST